MTVEEAIKIQKEFIANKYHIYKYSNTRLKESMKVLLEEYDKVKSIKPSDSRSLVSLTKGSSVRFYDGRLEEFS